MQRVHTRHNYDDEINADTSDAVVFFLQLLVLSRMDSLLNFPVELKTQRPSNPVLKKKRKKKSWQVLTVLSAWQFRVRSRRFREHDQ